MCLTLLDGSNGKRKKENKIYIYFYVYTYIYKIKYWRGAPANRIIHIYFSRTFTKQNSFICCFSPIFLLCIWCWKREWAREIGSNKAHAALAPISFHISHSFSLGIPLMLMLSLVCPIPRCDMIPKSKFVYARYFTIRCTQFQSSFTCIVLTRAHKIYVYVQ